MDNGFVIVDNGCVIVDNGFVIVDNGFVIVDFMCFVNIFYVFCKLSGHKHISSTNFSTPSPFT